MAAAQVPLLISKTEWVLNVAKEAMASRCVCVVADTAGIEDLLEDEANGVVVAQRTVAAEGSAMFRRRPRPWLAARSPSRGS
jgi:glycosyltransferase involved in cell wall biosynthesis